MPNRPQITLGFLPLLDSAILVVAVERGFASDENLDLRLVREASWTQVRDRVLMGQFAGAQMPGPLLIGSNLGLAPLAVPMVAPMALGLGGNAIVIAGPIHDEMKEVGLSDDLDPAEAGAALAAVVRRRRAIGSPRLRLAVGHRLSGANLALRYWLAASGIHPIGDVETISGEPAPVPVALSNGAIDGCCVGEPWASLAVERGQARIVTTTSAIWRSGPDKVLGLSGPWVEANPLLLQALLRALYRAAQWCANPANIEELAGILAARQYLDVRGELLLPGLTGILGVEAGRVVATTDFVQFEKNAATFPWQSHALWFYSQMVRWGDCAHHPLHVAIARDSYRPDLYRQALKPVFAPMPGANLKVEGALPEARDVGAANGRMVLGPDGFFDRGLFDPDRLDDYIAGQLPTSIA